MFVGDDMKKQTLQYKTEETEEMKKFFLVLFIVNIVIIFIVVHIIALNIVFIVTIIIFLLKKHFSHLLNSNVSLILSAW